MEERVLKFIHRQKREIKKLKKQRATLQQALREKNQEFENLLALYSNSIDQNTRLLSLYDASTAILEKLAAKQ